MIRYHIFLINNDVYSEYFYKSGILNRFLIAYMAEPNRPDLKQQFIYITCPIPHDNLEKNDQFIYLSDRIITVFSNAQLIMNNQFIRQLEKLNQHCFIVDHTNNNYSWLTPKKSYFNISCNVLEFDMVLKERKINL